MKVLLDTNIILDIILQREPFYNSSVIILKKADLKEIEAYITANSLTDIYYVLRKHFNDVESRKQAIKYILNIVDIIGVTKTDCFKALELEFSDFEDALQAQCAKKIRVSYIITRNVKDFKDKTIKVVDPEEFLSLLG